MADNSLKARTKGNPNQRGTDREGARLGEQRAPEDIPKQDTKDRKGNTVPGNVDVAAFQSSTVETLQAYALGPPARPPITHDNGFLALGTSTPTTDDYVALVKWRAMLEGGEALRPDLTDALPAYRHFLEGKGKPR